MLFEKENWDDLADKIKRILSDVKFADKLAENALRDVQEKFSETRYTENYRQLICDVLRSRRLR